MYDLFDFMHYSSKPAVDFIAKYGDEEWEQLDDLRLDADSVKSFLNASKKLDIVDAEDVIIAVGQSCNIGDIGSERCLLACMQLINQWQSIRSDENIDLNYDPIVKLILEVTEAVEKM